MRVCRITATAVVATALLLAVGPVVAPASAASGTDPGCVADIPQVRHLVLFGPDTGQETARAEVRSACGRLVGYYPEIAVAVASSVDSRFADRIGRDRAYSAQAEALTGTERPEPLPRAVGARSLLASPSERAGMDRTGEQWNMTLIGVQRARNLQRGNGQVLVGVLDTGIDGDHPELAAALDRSASAGCLGGVPDTRPRAWLPSGGPRSEHGTHVAGIIAAADDGVGVSGVAPGLRIASVKIVDASGFIYPEAAVCGVIWAARNKMRVTNNSYFVDPWLFACRSEPGQAVVYEALRRAVRYATEQGVLSVAAVGNENLDLADPQPRPAGRDCGVLPAQLPDVLTVSAVGAASNKSSYSSYGAGVVDVAAPGGDIRQRAPGANSGCVLSTVPGGYRSMCGTSMATPHVVGVAALVASAHPEARPAEVARLIESSATPMACPRGRYDPDSNGTADAVCISDGARTGFYGSGLLNAAFLATM